MVKIILKQQVAKKVKLICKIMGKEKRTKGLIPARWKSLNGN